MYLASDNGQYVDYVWQRVAGDAEGCRAQGKGIGERTATSAYVRGGGGSRHGTPTRYDTHIAHPHTQYIQVL